MIRYLTEDDVAAVLDVPTTIDLLDAAARALASDDAMNLPRQRPRTSGTVMHVLPAAYAGRLGHKTYVSAPKPRGTRFLYTLYAATGELLALIEANRLGQIRTGAASGLATRVLARSDTRIGAIVGTGFQARTQLEAICAVRRFEEVRVYGRTPANRDAFCRELEPVAGVRLVPSDDVAAAVDGADVICTMTNAAEPVLFGSMLAPGAHINAAGSNRANAVEIDAEVVHRSAVVAVEDVAQAKVESGDLLAAERAGRFVWDRALPLAPLVLTPPTRVLAGEITLFESLGIGLWDLAAASYVYDRCVEQRRGREVDLPA